MSVQGDEPFSGRLGLFRFAAISCEFLGKQGQGADERAPLSVLGFRFCGGVRARRVRHFLVMAPFGLSGIRPVAELCELLVEFLLNGRFPIVDFLDRRGPLFQQAFDQRLLSIIDRLHVREDFNRRRQSFFRLA